jgi:large subunit ribosomal protein L25
MDRQTLKAEVREITGHKVRRLRLQGKLPGNIYGKDIKSLAIQFDEKEFEKIYSKTGETGLIDVVVDSKKRPVLVHNIQTDPLKGFPLHVDLHQVDLKEKITAQVPVELEGESPAEKQGLGTVVQYINEVEIEALPTDLPESFKLDLSMLANVDDQIAVKDIKVDNNKIEILTNLEGIVIKVEPPQKEEVVEEVATPETTETAEGGENTTQETSKEEPKEK